MRVRRLPALAALLLAIASVALAVALAIGDFPRGLVVVAGVLLAALAAWYAVRLRGAARVIGLVAAVALLCAAVVAIVLEGELLLELLVFAGLGLALAAARGAFAVHVRLEPAPPPQRPVMFFNPRSGGGKAERFHLADEARRRGIEPVELRRGDDLETLVRAAVGDGADGLAMAGGDGSQAIVAAVAAECGLPYACIPAGTRNHFALDLGVDREDVVGALEAFTRGGERRVDLAAVNGRVFVNNVSLGLYADAVQQPGYREAKIRTLLETVPDVLGPGAQPSHLRWDGPNGDGSAAALLVSNNRYRLGRAVASGTRPALDRGVLGMAAIDASGPAAAVEVHQWSAPAFEVRSDAPVAAGIDGEATTLTPPLRFTLRPGVLRVRIAPDHPGASPSAFIPDTPWGALTELVRIAFGPASGPTMPTEPSAARAAAGAAAVPPRG